MKISPIALLLPLIFLCQGCLIFPYPTPEVKGTIVDAETQKPLVNARVELHNHKYTYCETTADGSFDMPRSSVWLPCLGMPGDIFIAAGTFDFKAPGYETVSRKLTSLLRTNSVTQLEKPVELRKLSNP
jgi:hypothetical protein